MRIIGLNIHRAFAARRWPGTAASSNDWGALTCAGPFSRLLQKKLSKDDVVVVEATGNGTASVALLIAPHVKKVVIANPKQVHASSLMRRSRPIRSMPASSPALCKRLSARSLDSRTSRRRRFARQVTRRNQIVRQRSRLKNIIQSILRPSDPLLPARRSVRGEQADIAFSPSLARGRTARRTASARVRSARR